jgi:RNA recognition motif-containing protein
LRHSGAPFRPKPAISQSLSNQEAGVFLPAFVHLICEYSFVTKLYVGNLPFTATEDSVRALFAPHGTVESFALVTDRDSGQPRGFGFIEMSNADAARAMQALNGTDFGGRALRVNEAQPREQRAGGGRGGSRRY